MFSKLLTLPCEMAAMSSSFWSSKITGSSGTDSVPWNKKTIMADIVFSPTTFISFPGHSIAVFFGRLFPSVPEPCDSGDANSLPLTLSYLGMGDCAWPMSISRPSRHSSWFRDGHMIQVGPMKASSEIFAGTTRKKQHTFCWHCWTVQYRMWAQSWQRPLHGEGLPASGTNPVGSETEREKEKLKDIIWVIPAVTEDRPTPGLQLPLLSTTWIRFLILATWHPEMINNGDHIMINNFAFPSSQLSWWDPASQLIFMLSIANDSCRHCGYSHE